MKEDGGGHLPVMFHEVMGALDIASDADRAGGYLDCTFGRGGHSRGILDQLGTNGRVLAFDRDPQAVEVGRALAARDPRFSIEHRGFESLQESVQANGWWSRLSGVVFDLGVSSPQLDDPQRGFSFLNDGPLDMRMDPEREPSAAEWLNESSVEEIEKVLRRLGQERFARRIARRIVQERPLSRTRELAELVAKAIPPKSREPGKHPATRTFQAVRMTVNDELDNLKRGLTQAAQGLRAGGRLVVLSFHSIEDRVVKHFIQGRLDAPRVPRHLPVQAPPSRLRVVGRALKASPEEVARNPRSRSAMLRVAQVVNS